MKRYYDLNENEKVVAKSIALNNLLSDILEGNIMLDDLQKKIDNAFQKSIDIQSPFDADYILDTCREELETLAFETAENSIYPESCENVITGVL
jgi:hypothetical protein